MHNLAAITRQLERSGISLSVPIQSIRLANGQQREFAFLKDPDGNLVELIENTLDDSRRPAVRGLAQVTIGVRDMDRSVRFYHDVVGYDRVLFETSGRASVFDPLFRGKLSQREVLLGRSSSLRSPFVVPNGGTVRLVQALDYEGKELSKGRPWGNPGFQMECCFEVEDIHATVEELKSNKQEIFRPATKMNLGSGSHGYFAYVKDPDGSLVEFVEVSRVTWLSPRAISIVWPVFSPLASRMFH